MHLNNLEMIFPPKNTNKENTFYKVCGSGS